MINGGREVGPNAVLALKREGYKNTDFSLYDTFDSLTYKGFLNFFAKNTSFAMGEFLSSLSKMAFVAKSKKLIPDVEEYMFVKGGTAGVRAQAISPQGDLIMDFNIIKENKTYDQVFGDEKTPEFQLTRCNRKWPEPRLNGLNHGARN